MDTLSGMRLFAKVVETGGFSAAGRQVGVNASSVSRLVGRLEDSLGTRLLNRSTRAYRADRGGPALLRAGAPDRRRCGRGQRGGGRARRGAARHAQAQRARWSSDGATSRLTCGSSSRPTRRCMSSSTSPDHYVDLIEEGADLAIRIGGPSPSSYNRAQTRHHRPGALARARTISRATDGPGAPRIWRGTTVSFSADSPAKWSGS